MYTMIEFIMNDILSFHDELERREQFNNYIIHLQQNRIRRWVPFYSFSP